jgi:LuxR family maltose regulon positive regulatory protein
MLSLLTGQTTGIEEKLQVAEAIFAAQKAFQGTEQDDKTRDLIGQIAASRATLALTRYQPEVMITQARRALEYLHPDNQFSRVRAIWTLGFAYQVQGDRAAAGRAYTEAIAVSQASGIIRMTIQAKISGRNTGNGKSPLSGSRDVSKWPATGRCSSAAL